MGVLDYLVVLTRGCDALPQPECSRPSVLTLDTPYVSMRILLEYSRRHGARSVSWQGP